MSIAIGLPFILIWVIGFPVVIFVQLFRKRHDLNDKNTIIIYGLFFVGLSDRAYFYEVVVSNLRKLLFIICSSLLAGVSGEYKVS